MSFLRLTNTLQTRCCHRQFLRVVAVDALKNRSKHDINSIFYRAATNTTSSSSSDQELMSILQKVQNGTLSITEAEARLQMNNKTSTATTTTTNNNNTLSPLESFANIDHNRAHRTGFPEAVFSAGKTPEQIISILDSMANHVNARMAEESAEVKDDDDVFYSPILATRVDQSLYDQISQIPPPQNGIITYHPTARIITMIPHSLEKRQNKQPAATTITQKKVIIATAGTTDLPVAEEAAITLASAGIPVERVYDVGVAGLHRIINALPKLRNEDVGCILVCAGMDGALPSVVGGLVSVPVIAVPTSVGYGACFGGVSALLTMLNTCSPGVGVVNIDNGFGAAALAFKCLIN